MKRENIGVAIVAFAVALTLAYFWYLVSAGAHDELQQSDWIGQSQIKGVNGQLCCGWNDCPRVNETDVKDEPDGVHVKMHVHEDSHSGNAYMGVPPRTEWDDNWEEIIPYTEVQPSADGYTYRCAWPNPRQRKCFFRKMPGT